MSLYNERYFSIKMTAKGMKIYVGKVETRDKRLLCRNPDRSLCHRHTSVKLFW
jgi:hypothetical protein